MNTTYIAISIIVLVLVAMLVYISGRKGTAKPLSPLAGLAFGFILAGLFFGQDKWLGYGLLAIGVILAVIDMVKKSKQK